MNAEKRALLDKILGMYKPECRYLKEAELIHDNFMHGIFEISSTFYAADTGHLNAAELIICYNQLSYAFLDERSRLRQDELNCGHMEASELGKMQLRKCFICSADKVRFNKEIDPKNFEGSIEIESVKSRGGDTFYKTLYNFGDGAATGRILLLKKN